MRRRKAHKPSPSSTPADTNNQITYNPAYATIEGTYSEINDNAVGIAGHPGQRLDRENYVAFNSASTDYINAAIGDETYEIPIADHKLTSHQEPRYDVATMMTSHQDFGLDSHPYDEVVEMRSSKNTSTSA